MRWCRTLIKDTEQYFAKFYNSNLELTKRMTQTARASEYSAQRTARNEEYNSVVLAPSDM